MRQQSVALLRNCSKRLSKGLLSAEASALSIALQHPLPSAQGAHRSCQCQAGRWASTSGTNTINSVYQEVPSWKSFSRAERGVQWPQVCGMSRRSLSAQQVRCSYIYLCCIAFLYNTCIVTFHRANACRACTRLIKGARSSCSLLTRAWPIARTRRM